MILRLALKSAVAGGFIYYTKEIGVWGSSKQTEILYNDIKNVIQPYVTKTKQKMPFEVPALPQTGKMRFLAKHYYNQGVKASIRFIYMLPCYTGQMFKKVKDGVNKALEAPPDNKHQ